MARRKGTNCSSHIKRSNAIWFQLYSILFFCYNSYQKYCDINVRIKALNSSQGKNDHCVEVQQPFQGYQEL